jgi:hypothetical protein
MILLYEVSIWVAKIVKQKKSEQDESDSDSDGINKEDDLLEDFIG